MIIGIALRNHPFAWAGVAILLGLAASLAAADDPPIVITGGSLYLRANGVEWQVMRADHSLRYPAARTVPSIGVIEPNGRYTQFTVSPTASGNVSFVYCAKLNRCTGSNLDTVTLSFNNQSRQIQVTNTQRNIDAALPAGNGSLKHVKDSWKLKEVRYSGGTEPLNCGKQGRCTVIIHLADQTAQRQ